MAIEPIVTTDLASALEWSDFTTGGDVPWSGFNAAAASTDGEDFAAPSSLTFGTSTWLQTTVTGPCRFFFRQRVTPAANYMAFQFSRSLRVDGIFTDAPWENTFVDLGPGVHTLRWEYKKTNSASTLQPPDWMLDQFHRLTTTTPAAALDFDAATGELEGLFFFDPTDIEIVGLGPVGEPDIFFAADARGLHRSRGAMRAGISS